MKFGKLWTATAQGNEHSQSITAEAVCTKLQHLYQAARLPRLLSGLHGIWPHAIFVELQPMQLAPAQPCCSKTSSTSWLFKTSGTKVWIVPCTASHLEIDPERKHCQRRLAPTSSLAPASSTLATMRRPNYKQVRKPTRRTLVGANDTHTFSLPVRNRGSIKAAVKPGHKRKRKNTFIMAWKV